jgi:hypothetical protein
MTSKPHSKVSQDLLSAQTAMSNSLVEQDILTRVNGFGYTPTRLAEGQQVLAQAEAAVQAFAIAKGNQRVATAQVKVSRTAARSAYLEVAQLARAIFPRDSAHFTTLDIQGNLPTRLADFIRAGYTLFDNARADADIAAALSDYAYTAARLAEGRGVIEALDQAQQAQAIARGDKQQAAVEQAAALLNLRRWVAQYRKVARLALADAPQLLEKIGVTVRAAKTPAQIAAPQKAAATRRARREAALVKMNNDQVTMINDQSAISNQQSAID